MENKEHTDQNPDLDQNPVQEENSSPVELKETNTETPESVPEKTDSTEELPISPETAETEVPKASTGINSPAEEIVPQESQPAEPVAEAPSATEPETGIGESLPGPVGQEEQEKKKEKKVKKKEVKKEDEELQEKEDKPDEEELKDKEKEKEKEKEKKKREKKKEKELTDQEEDKEPPKEEQKDQEMAKKEDPPDHLHDDDAEDDSEHDTDQEDSSEDLNQFTPVQLLDLLETAVLEPDLNAVKTRIALIKMAFLKKREDLPEQLSSEEEAEDESDKGPGQAELDTRFDGLFSIYKTNKARFLAEQEKQKKENLERKNKILEELRNLISSEETLKKTYDEFKILQDQWKEVGMVPRSEINNLWQNYHFLVEKFFEKVKLNKELKDLDLKKNLEAKIELCEKTEELLLESSILKSFKQLQKYHDEWKEIGPVPTDKKDEIWERFKNATDKINERRREYYSSVEEEQNKNLETKNALCQQAEEVLTKQNETVRDWQEQTHKVNELLTIWKSVGPVPQKQNTEIWNRFKGCLDAFFASKKEFFDRVKDQQMHNYNLKLDLCAQAESLRSSTDWKKTTNDLIQLQGEWKRIGPVPRKHSDKIWKRFRSACDEFFRAKSSYFSNIHTHEDENMRAKEALLKKLKEHQFGENKSKNLDDLKFFQREWTQIGHVPFKERDRLQNEFRKLVNEHLDKLKISELEMTAVSYQTKMESMKNDPQGRRMMTRERDTLTIKINKLREDINLWENNIGFLAKSKNANLLKVEFEKKIEKAKSELKVMEAKFKILRQQ